MSEIKVSVIIPTYNRPEKLGRLLNSLIHQVVRNQLEKQIEIIVIDDCSASSAQQEVNDFLSHRDVSFIAYHVLAANKGPAFARNLGIAKSRGKVIAFSDDDHVVAGNYLTALIIEHDQHPDVFVINGNLMRLRNDFYSKIWDSRYRAFFVKDGGSNFYEINGVSSGHLSIKRLLLERISPLFDGVLLSQEDFDLYIRLKEKGIKVFKSDCFLAYHDYRKSFWQMVRQKAWYINGWNQLIQKYGIQRIRAEVEARKPFTPFEEPLWFRVIMRLVVYSVLAFGIVFKPQTLFRFSKNDGK